MNDVSKNIVTVDDVVSAYFAQGQNGAHAQDDQGNTVTVSADQIVNSGTEIGGITIGNVRTAFYAPDGGDNVTVYQRLNDGVPVADITINGNTQTLYAPAGGEGGSTVIQGDTVSVSPILNSGTAIATVTVNNNQQTLYAPAVSSGGGSGSGSTYLPEVYTFSASESFSNAIVTSLNITDSFYIEGIFYKANSGQSNIVSLWGRYGTDPERLLVNSLSVNTNADTYFAIYGKRITNDGKWVCWAKTSNSPDGQPSASGTSVNGSSWHALGGWDKDIGNQISALNPHPVAVFTIRITLPL